MTQRLPTPGSDDNLWGTILNEFLEVSHNSDGTLNSSALSAAGVEMTANKGAVSGYAPLDSASKLPVSNLPVTIPVTNLGSGTTNGTTFLRGDGTWAAISGGGGSGLETVNTVSTSGSTQTIPDVATATISYITLTADCTLTFPAATVGKMLTVALIQDSTGSRAIIWPGTVKWSEGVTPVLTSTASKTDLFTFLCLDGSHWLGFITGQDF
jgi:hypothetical protein